MIPQSKVSQTIARAVVDKHDAIRDRDKARAKLAEATEDAARLQQELDATREELAQIRAHRDDLLRQGSDHA